MTKHEPDCVCVHPLYAQLRELRKAARLSLKQFAARYGETDVVVGSYERGDRQATIASFDRLLGHFGRRLAIVPINAPGTPTVWTDDEAVAALRSIAAHLEAAHRPDPDALAHIVAQRTGDA